MVQHIWGVTGRCFYQLRQICGIRKSLMVETAKLLVHAFVNSRLDYCNSVLQGVTAVHLQKLQVIQNGAAWIVARKRKFDPITSTLRDELHWLPIVQRIHFKQCMLVYRSLSLHGMAPSYIADVCMKRSFESEHYNLRSAVRGELVVPLARKSTPSHRSFKYSCPSLSNALPHEIRDPCLTFSQFRSRLKTPLLRLRDGSFMRGRYINVVTYLLTYLLLPIYNLCANKISEIFCAIISTDYLSENCSHVTGL